MKNNLLGKEYQNFLFGIKERISKAQYVALYAVNKELISLYWDIGRSIVEKQDRLGWGKAIIENLSKDLQKDFPGIKGFSSQNLWRMRIFYLNYVNDEKLSPLVREISWANNTVILDRCKTSFEKEFYLKMTKKFGWSKRILVNQIENKAYEKYLINQTNFDITISEKYKEQAKLAVKDEYTFDFLEMGEFHSEKELETALIDKIKDFLTEMGGYFCFIGSQYGVEVDGEEYFIDLLLYHRKLRSLVAIELKIGKFKPEYSGKMQFYLSALDDTLKLPHENASIGLIICKEKSKTTVEYALKNTNKPIGVATYKITSSLPKELIKYLPSKKEIKEKLKNI